MYHSRRNTLTQLKLKVDSDQYVMFVYLHTVFAHIAGLIFVMTKYTVKAGYS